MVPKEINICTKAIKKEIKKQNFFLEVCIFVVAFILIVGLTYLTQYFYLTNSIFLIRVLTLLTYFGFIIVAVVASLLVGEASIFLIDFRKIFIQLLIGTALAISLWFLISFIPNLITRDLKAIPFEVETFIYNVFLYLFFVGPGEEIVFRGYAESQIEKWLKKVNFFAPFIVAILFGLLHLINGNFPQFIITTLIELILGYAKFYFINCSLYSVALAHGLYDLLNQSLKYFSF